MTDRDIDMTLKATFALMAVVGVITFFSHLFGLG